MKFNLCCRHICIRSVYSPKPQLNSLSMAFGISLLSASVDKTQRLKPWPNGLASRRKSTQVFDLSSTCVSFGHPLAMTLVELKFVGKSTHVFHRLATQRKSTQVDTGRVKPLPYHENIVEKSWKIQLISIVFSIVWNVFRGVDIF